MKSCLLFIFFITSQVIYSQHKCEMAFKLDSCSLQNTHIKELVELIDVKIKNNYQIQFIKHKNLQYLKIIVRNDLGYGKTCSLTLLSSKKQYFTKSITLQVIDKTSAYLLLELNSNYLRTIIDNGLTSIIFCENMEFVIPKSDSELIKQGAFCFHEKVVEKK